MTIYKQSNLTWDDYIRLNDIHEPHVLEASDTIAEQEIELQECYDRIESLENLIQSFDIDTLNIELAWIEQCCDANDGVQSSLVEITKILDNFKLRTKEI